MGARTVISPRWYQTVPCIIAISVVCGCSGTDAAGGIPAFSTIPYNALQLNVHAVVMSTIAPYDTLQLTAIPVDGSGHVISSSGTVTYSVTDTNITVSPTGLLIARHTTTNAVVVATLQDPELTLTHVDTAFITVTTNAAPSKPLTAFSIHLPATDSNQVDLPGLIGTGTKQLPVVATDADGTDLSSALLVRFVSLDPSAATVDPTGMVKAVFPGHARLVASATYYGVTKTDTVNLRIGYPDAVAVTGKSTAPGVVGFIPKVVTIGVGGTVVFKLNIIGVVGNVLDAAFDDSTVVQQSPLDSSLTLAQNGSGNVGPLVPPPGGILKIPAGSDTAYILISSVCNTSPYPCAVMRAFPKAGIYHYRSVTDSGGIGTIYVMENPK
jgi:hypothetical protein